jgi:DNA polymerase III gamma/tau subunit
MLDKLSVYSDEMSLDNFYKIKGIMSENDVQLFVEDILAQDMNKIVDNFDQIRSSSIKVDILLVKILEVFKNKLINDVNKNLDLKDFLFKAISIINNSLIDMKKTLYPQIMFEVCILKIMDLYMNQSTINIVEEETDVFEKQEIFAPKAKKEELKEVEKKEEFKETKNLVKKVNREEKFYDNKNVLGEIRKIRINNTFCDPNKKLLEDLRIKWINLVDVINDKEFSIVSSYVVDAYICVASQNHLILKVEYSSIVNNAMNNIEKIEDLICKVLNNRYKVVFVTNEEWVDITKEYKKNFKNKKLDKYKFVEEQEILKKIKENKKESKIVNDATSLFGDVVIEIK